MRLHKCIRNKIRTCIHMLVCIHTLLKYTFLQLGLWLKDMRLCQDEKSLSHFVICDFERSGRLECIATLG